MFEEKPSLRPLEAVVRKQLASSFNADEIDPILASAEEDNPAAEFIVAGALEAGGEGEESMKWYRRSAEQGYLPALERLRRNSANTAWLLDPYAFTAISVSGKSRTAPETGIVDQISRPISPDTASTPWYEWVDGFPSSARRRTGRLSAFRNTLSCPPADPGRE